MKVETFTGFTESGLTNKINRFLTNNNIEVIEIKFSTSFFYMGAMVVYTEKQNA